jgi:hypothetical protein
MYNFTTTRLGLGKVRVWGPLGGSAFKYDARTRGGVVNLLEALEFDFFLCSRQLSLSNKTNIRRFSENAPFVSGENP